MSPFHRLAPVVFLAALLPVEGDPPVWWQEGDPAVIDPAAATNNHGAANIGQAKWMTTRALEALGARDAPLAAEITQRLTQPQPSAAGGMLPAVVDLAVPQPLPQGWAVLQRAPLRLGQLKALATPFYQLLQAKDPAWLAAERTLNRTQDPADPANFYPWTTTTLDDANQAIATIGQLKAVFSLRFDLLGTPLDEDADGLTYAVEICHGTNPRDADSDGDGMPDGWEVQWGLDPLNPPDATADADGDHVTNLREFQLGTCPTGIYRIEILPLVQNKYFHSAADDGSVVVQESLLWDPARPLQRITVPDANGDRAITPVPASNWNPLDTIVSDLLARELPMDETALNPCVAESSAATFRVYQGIDAYLILQQPGSYVRSLPADVAWQAINNCGQAAGIRTRQVAATADIPAHDETNIVIDYGYATIDIPMPAEWFPAAAPPTIQARSEDGLILIRRPMTHPDGTALNQASLLNLSTRGFTTIKQPGSGGAPIVALSDTNGRMLGGGTTPFHITRDGTPVRLRDVHIIGNGPAAATPLSALYPNTLTPNHITSDGRITLTTTDADGQTTLLQIIPDNDADNDHMMDDWEKSFAKALLDLNKSSDDWGDHYPDLVAGDLNPTSDYTGDNITAAEVEDLTNLPATELPNDGIRFEHLSRRNILAWGLHVPAPNGGRERNEGRYLYENSGWFGREMGITSFAQLQPEFMAQQILLNEWDRGAWYNFSRFCHMDFPNRSEYYGEIRQLKVRLLAKEASTAARNQSYLKYSWRARYDLSGNKAPDEVISVENTQLIIPAGKLTSDWVELSSPVVDGYEYWVTLEKPQIAVDANRDGVITFDGLDKTTQDKPFTFWVNDDHDVKHPVDLVGLPFPLGLGQEDMVDGTKDCDDDQILFVRDLEDFTRLHLYLPVLKDQFATGETLSVGLEFTETTDNPSIKVYRAREENGGCCICSTIRRGSTNRRHALQHLPGYG